MKSKSFLIAVLVPVFAAAIGLAQTVVESEPIEIDPDQGKENTKRVVDQLRTLLMPASNPTVEPSVVISPAIPPYLKIIQGPENRSTMIYQCRNAKVASLVRAVESVISMTGSVESSEERNMIVINDMTEKMSELEAAVIAMDIAPPQVLVEAKIVEVITADGVERDLRVMFQQYDKDLNLTSGGGMTLDAPNSQVGTASDGAGFDFFPYKSGRLGDDWKKFNIALKWLLSAQDARILSSPNLIVNVGKTAGIITGEDVPIQSSQVVGGAINTSIEFRRIGVKLNVTPTMVNGRMIHLQISPEVSQVTRYENFTQDKTTFRVPVIAIRNLNTELTLNDGDVVMLGGLYSSQKTSLVEKPPILGEIPYLGTLFSSQTENNSMTQLIFFLKIHLLEAAPGSIFYHTGEKAEELQKIGDIIERSPEVFPKNRLSTFQKISKDLFGDQAIEIDQGPERHARDRMEEEIDIDRSIERNP
jgi:type II secretory pathway component GspD/PulD (secretin)